MSAPASARDRLIIALDVPARRKAMDLAQALEGRVGMFKVGLELFCAEGAPLVHDLQQKVPVFLDLKLHDIPNTVERALEALLPMDPRLLTIHAQGGFAMMEAAAEAVRRHRDRGGRTELLAVTVLTSLSREDLARTGHGLEPGDLALRLARLARTAGCDGVVCSAHEAGAIRSACGETFRLLTPGIRPGGAALQDQARVVTPAQALRAGATWLVVGRPVTQSPDPAEAARAILGEMAEGA